MDKYTQVLEFFMENGVQLTTEQMDELKDICESGGALKRLINDRTNKVKQLQKDAAEYNAIGTPKRKEEAEKLLGQADKIEYRNIAAPTSSITKHVRHRYSIAPENGEARYRIRNDKDALGQGKDNIPKEREAGTYLQKQHLIDKYNK